MPVNTTISLENWTRYAYARDNGHQTFIDKAEMCDAFFRGDQWREEDRAMLREQRRPALTLNKIMGTVANMQGEQIQSRSEITFRPKDGADPQTAETLAKVFKHISEETQLDWKRSDMFTDGLITSRGFIDLRMAFDTSMRGNIDVQKLNPKNVIVDPDADDMDPDTWNELFITKWLTIDDIEVLYGREDAMLLKGRGVSDFPYGYDSIDRVRDRFGERYNHSYGAAVPEMTVARNLRVLERQYRKLSSVKFLVDPKTGDMREIPATWEPARIKTVAQQFGLTTTKKTVKRIRWTVTCDNVVLHDEWSPYKHFTVIPYFPHFRHGHTVGPVEQLLDPQDLLNKTMSQELHVINTTANSGWIVKTGALKNMSIAELEARGSQTGVVLEVDDPNADIEKITPNQVPTGLERISYKATELLKEISGVGDSQQGMDRADVAAKAIQAKQKAGSTVQVKPLDSLVRTDFIIARNALDLIQEFYTEERIITITHDRLTGETQDMPINQAQADGTIVNDLTLGSYEVVISSVPQRETLEDSQFDQAVALKELGIQIPDDVLIGASRLVNKADIIKKMQAAASTPEAQQQQQLTLEQMKATVEETQAKTARDQADAKLKGSKVQETSVKTQRDLHTPIEPPAGGENPVQAAAEHEQQLNLDLDKHEHDKEMDRQALKIKQTESQAKIQLQEQEAAQKAVERRQAAAHARAHPPAQAGTPNTAAPQPKE